MAEKSWLKKIAALKRLIRETGPLWPDSTKLSGFGNKGPYSCSNCEYFKGDKASGICIQEVVIADSEVKKNQVGLPIIDDPEHQCCTFVEPPKEKENG